VRSSLLLLVVVLLPGAAFSAPPVDRTKVYEQAGMAELEIDRIELGLAEWTAKPGSPEAVACFEEAGVGPKLAACAQLARAADDRAGARILLTLDGCWRVARGDFPGAAEALGVALELTRDDLPADDPLQIVLRSSLGVALAAAGDLEASITVGREAIDLAARVLGEGHEYVAQNQLIVAWHLFHLGRTAEGLAACEPAVADPEAGWLHQWPGMACFVQLGIERRAAGDLDGAAALWRHALAIGEGLAEADSPELISVVASLGDVALKKGRFAEAKELLGRAQGSIERVYPEGAPERVGYLPHLAEAHAGLGELDEAGEAYRRSLAHWEEIHGPDSAEAATGLHYLARIRQKQGRYAEAEELLLRAVGIGERLGPRSVTLGASHGEIALLYQEMGRREEAAGSYRRALAIHEQHYGPDHVEVATLLLNQGSLLRDMGDRARAREGYERALTIFEASYGEVHAHVATALTNLAGLRLDLGDLEGAMPLLERSVAVYEQTVGPDHEWVASGLNNLAMVHQQLGDLQTAWELLARAVAIWERALGPDHPNTVAGRNNLAFVLADNGDLAEALAMFEAEVVTASERLGPEHPTVATAIANAAGILRLVGDLDGARRRYEQALDLRVGALGRDHPHVASTRVELARIDLESGDREGAREEMALAFAQVTEQVVPLLDVTSERERIALVQSLRGDLDLYVTLFDRPGDTADVHRAVLAWKAVVKNSLAEQRDALMTAREPELAGRLTELAEVRRSLATAVFAEASDSRAGIPELMERKEELERELARRSRSFQEKRRLDGTSSRQVCAGLARDEAVVDVLRYERAASRPDEEATDRYLAVVLRGGQCAEPVRVDLGDAAEVDQAIARYRRKVSQLSFGARLRQQAQGLRELLWDPVEPHLAGRDRIWLVPDGALTGLPFGALLDDDGTYLVERFSIGYLASGNDLLRKPGRPGVGALVVGGVDYDGGAPAVPAGQGQATTRSAPRDALQAFAFLPASASEAGDVAARLGGGEVVRLTGAEATEGRVRALAVGRRVIHLATHGFFAAGRVPSALEGQAGEVRVVDASTVAAGLNPMLLSGVVLAGANAPDGDGVDDGVLTAEEVVALDLRGVELVTLSACETGLGEVERGEGVMGLRRAFALAGARSLVFSLWQVPDAETGRLMTAFYDRLAADPALGPSDAFRGAQLQLIEELRTERGDAPPLFWAAFVVSGR